MTSLLRRFPIAWRIFVARCRREGTAPLVERHLRRLEGLVPAPALAELRTIRLAAAARHLRAVEILRPLLCAARAEGVAIAVGKGFHWAESLYPEPGLRPYLDVDLLVPPSAWRGTLELLRRFGFQPDAGSRRLPVPSDRTPAWTLSPVFRAGGLAVELHPNPFGLQAPSRADAELWLSLRAKRIGGVEVLAPAWPHELLHAAVHAQQHSYTRLSWLVDLAEMAGRSDLDWSEASRLARIEGLQDAVRHGLRIVALCWPGSVPVAADRLFPSGCLVERASRLLWPVEAVAGRKPMPEAPYYMPTVFALLRRGSPAGAVRSLRPIFFPPRGWVAAQLPDGGPVARARYAVSRLLRPLVYLVQRRLAGR